MSACPLRLRRTLTWDQGKELALHQLITAATGIDVFFCDAHAPWQRDSNENMNGLLRDYFPKGTDLGVHTLEDLARVAAEVNERPRKTLGWSRPVELFGTALALPLTCRDHARPARGLCAVPARARRALKMSRSAALAADLRHPPGFPQQTAAGEGNEDRPRHPLVDGDRQLQLTRPRNDRITLRTSPQRSRLPAPAAPPAATENGVRPWSSRSSLDYDPGVLCCDVWLELSRSTPGPLQMSAPS